MVDNGTAPRSAECDRLHPERERRAIRFYDFGIVVISPARSIDRLRGLKNAGNIRVETDDDPVRVDLISKAIEPGLAIIKPIFRPQIVGHAAADIRNLCFLHRSYVLCSPNPRWIIRTALVHVR